MMKDVMEDISSSVVVRLKAILEPVGLSCHAVLPSSGLQRGEPSRFHDGGDGRLDRNTTSMLRREQPMLCNAIH